MPSSPKVMVLWWCLCWALHVHAQCCYRGFQAASLGSHRPAIQVEWQPLEECASGAGRMSSNLVEASPKSLVQWPPQPSLCHPDAKRSLLAEDRQWKWTPWRVGMARSRGKNRFIFHLSLLSWVFLLAQIVFFVDSEVYWIPRATREVKIEATGGMDPSLSLDNSCCAKWFHPLTHDLGTTAYAPTEVPVVS